MCSTGLSRSTPSIGQRRGADPVDPGAHRDQHLAQVDDLGLAGRVVQHAGALGQHRGHQQVLGGARPTGSPARARRRSGRPAPRRPPGRARPARRPRARADRPCACPAPREPIASPPGSATLARWQRATSGPSTAIEARSRRTSSYGASQAELLGHLDPDDAAGRARGRVDVERVVDVDRAAQPAEQLAHHGHVQDVGDVVDRAGPRGEQRGGHQLQRRVLRTADVHRALERAARAALPR